MKAVINRVVTWVKTHLTLLKVLFVVSVLVFVMFEIGRISRDLNGDTMKQSLAAQPWWSLLLMLVAGLLAVTPMLNYDRIITHMLPGDYPLPYVVKSGWIVNSFTNIAGFGGFLGASLRANFYHKEATQKQILFAISKIALFLLAGLSIWSTIALILAFGFQLGSPSMDVYWPWLAGGALYFPILMVATHLTNKQFFKDLPLRREISLTLGSFFEWGGAALFFLLIGQQMGVTIHLAQVLPLFMVANVLGVISMVPGGLGSFDVFMIMALSQIGLDYNTAVVWLLFYRLFYYVVPFAIGAVLFAQDAGKRVNEYLEGLPLQMIHKVAHLFLIGVMYFSAVMLLLRGVVPDFALRSRLYVRLSPYTFIFLSRATNILVAFIIFGFARGIANRVKAAYWPTLGLIAMAFITSIVKGYSLRFVIFMLLVLGAAVLSRKELYRSRMDFPWGNRLIDIGIFGFTAIFYAVALYWNAPALRHRRPVPDVFLFPSERVWFTTVIGVAIAAITLTVIYHYLATPLKDLGDPYDEARIKAIVDQYGGNEVSHLAYTRDKQVRFYQVDGQDQVFFLFRKKTDKIVILGEPVGNPEHVMAAIADFITAADDQDLGLVFYEIEEQLTMKLHEYGFDFMKFGEEGYVDVTNFTLAGTKRKGERALMHKFERLGYRFEWLEPPFSPELIAELKTVSDSWLEDRPEKGFSLGFFDEHYLNQAPIGVIKDEAGAIVAFANAMPMGSKDATSIDLMRSSDDAPSGIMDGIFINLFQRAQEDGFQYFNMGMAPLANVGTSRYSFMEEKMAHLVYEYGYRFYGFQGLRSYKNKYVTTWKPKYLAYRKRTSLLFTLLQVLLLVNTKVGDKPRGNGFFERRIVNFGKVGYALSKQDDKGE